MDVVYLLQLPKKIIKKNYKSIFFLKFVVSFLFSLAWSKCSSVSGIENTL